ncbi:MAG: flagellar hook-basal body protein [Desulfitobacteriia bacterium]|jgi:flagellar basal-body rod protein FlgG
MRISSEYISTFQSCLDFTGNNLANINTPAFKEQLFSVKDIYKAQDRSTTDAQYGGVRATPNPILDPNRYGGDRYNFRPGSLEETGNPLDLAIKGEGFFQIRTTDGRLGYTRAGLFTIDGAGNLVNNEGLLLEPALRFPAGACDIRINKDGSVTAKIQGEEDEATPVTIGEIRLYRFNNPQGLEIRGHNIFLPTPESGAPLEGRAGEGGFGEILAGKLEKSNTDFVTAMTNMIEAQRAYQFDLRIIKQRDEIIQQTVGMRG